GEAADEAGDDRADPGRVVVAGGGGEDARRVRRAVLADRDQVVPVELAVLVETGLDRRVGRVDRGDVADRGRARPAVQGRVEEAEWLPRRLARVRLQTGDQRGRLARATAAGDLAIDAVGQARAGQADEQERTGVGGDVRHHPVAAGQAVRHDALLVRRLGIE